LRVKTLPLIWVVLLFASCAGEARRSPGEEARRVRGAEVKSRELPDEIEGFGTLSFLKKVDLGAPEDGVLKSLYYREGDLVPGGAEVAVLENPQILLALGRAENAHTQALAAVDLARARLFEAELQSEARFLGLEKAGLELEEARRNLGEQRRKQGDQQVLYRAGGLSDEAYRSSLFALESAEVQFRLLEKDLEIRRIGSRDRDLEAAGYPPSAEGEERLRALIRLSTATARAELQAAEALLQGAAKELESARLVKEGLVLRSPAPGIVGARYLEVGERVKREDKVLTLMDTGSLYAVFSAREADARRIQKGMAARVSLDGIEGSFPGTVDLVSPQADSQSFSFPVRVLLPPEALAEARERGGGGELLKPGMFARVSVSAGPPRQALFVPESALMDLRNREARVFTIAGKLLSERRITVGELLGTDREIGSGLSAGEVVVRHPDSSLKEGLHVSVSE
jgi:RND family efflux transporter MFP subunit